jgi:hypothetical protein
VVILIVCLVGPPGYVGCFLKERPLFGRLVQWTNNEILAFPYSSRSEAQDDVDFVWGSGTKLVALVERKKVESNGEWEA